MSKNILEKYDELMKIENIGNDSIDKDIESIGILIDISLDLKKKEGLQHALNLINKVKSNNIDEEKEALIHYFAANAWADIRLLTTVNEDDKWNWERYEFGHELINLRMASRLMKNYQDTKDKKYRYCQILTNLANTFDHIGRFSETLEYFDDVLLIDSNFNMAVGNKGICLSTYARSLYDMGHSYVFLYLAKENLHKALKGELEGNADKYFERYLTWITSILPENYELPDFNKFLVGESEDEIEYRKWILKNRLFLNPLNDLGSFSIAAQDILTLPNMVTKIDEGPFCIAYYNQMKQEFASARFLYYESINQETNDPHFSDKGVLLYNTLDYPAHCLNIEKMKCAYMITYSIFDKISFLINQYFDLSIPERDVSFRTIWYKKENKKFVLRSEFSCYKNWPLRGLFWLSKDLFENKTDFKDALEPEAKELYLIRNYLTHKYLRIHDDIWDVEKSFLSPFSKSILALSVNRTSFTKKTLKLLKLVRCALIYLSLAIHAEESIRHEKRDKNLLIAPAPPLDIWEDEWKF